MGLTLTWEKMVQPSQADKKQRIAIARALYKDPEILILDEATSSLDSASERYVQQAVDMLRQQNKTVIMIAHRLSTIYKADKIIVLEKGKVVEAGNHIDLMAQEGHYHQLWLQQFPSSLSDSFRHPHKNKRKNHLQNGKAKKLVTQEM